MAIPWRTVDVRNEIASKCPTIAWWACTLVLAMTKVLFVESVSATRSKPCPEPGKRCRSRRMNAPESEE